MFQTAAVLRAPLLASALVILLASTAWAAPCPLKATNPSITICSPASNAVVSSSVAIAAGSTDSAGAIAMAIYVDNALVKKVNGGQISASGTFATGKHYLVAQLWDRTGRILKQPAYFNVSTSTPAPKVAFAASAADTTTGNATLTWSTTNATSVTIDNGVGSVATSGNRIVSPSATTTYTLRATGPTGTTATATAMVAEPSRPSRPDRSADCTSSPTAPSVTMCMPSNGSTVTSPVHVIAFPTSSNGVAAMAVYVDNNLAYKDNVQTVDTDLAMALGNHYVVVQFWDNSGSVPAKASVNIVVSGGSSNVDVATAHNDPARDGANTSETILAPSNVTPAHFGKIVGYGVDGQIYAQPLVLSNVLMGSGANNVVYVATEHDSVYAFDADDKTGTPYWSVSLLAPGQSPAASSDSEGISPEIGITGTPVIDRAQNALYVVSMVHVSGAGNEFWIHALDLATGAEKFGGPKRINPTVSGTGYGSTNGVVPIEDGCYQRPGLALGSGNVYVSFGHCSHGWVAAFNETSLAQTAVYNTSPNGKGAAIWMGGGAPAMDANGNLYFETGVDADSTTNSGYSDAFLKLSPSLALLDYFQVSNNAYLTQNDADLGSGAPIVMPDNSSSFPHEVIGAGKDGRIFVVNRDNMGQFDPNANHVVQVVQSGTQQFDNFFDQPAYWNGYVYYHAENDVLRQFSWTNGLLSTSPVHTGAVTYGVHGATPSVSASGASNGIVWELQVDGQPSGPALLHAYDATDVSKELYNSSMNSGDAAGPAVKFTVPTIANGKVYVPAGNQVDIYGPK